MKLLIRKIKTAINPTSLLVILIIIISVFIVTRSLLRPGYFPMHDDMQAMRVLQIDKCISDGQIPCRWVPDMGYGYGYPQFIYYGPLPYYLMEGFHLVGLPILDSVKAGIILGFVVSAIGMFLLGKALWGIAGGTLSTVFYLFAPYRASDIYTRGAVGEFWAMAFLPFIFWSIYQIIHTDKRRHIVYFSLSITGLLITHNLTTIAFSPFVILWTVFWLCKSHKRSSIKEIIIGITFGIGLAGFYVLPVIFEKNFVHIETMLMGYFNYLAHFVSIRQLLLSTHWGFGSSELGPHDDLSFQVGIFHWVIALTGIVVALINKHKDRLLLSVLLIMFVIALFLTHQKSVFVWNNLPFMAYFQFPWRFLTIVVFVASLMVGFLVSKYNNIKNDKKGSILLMILCVSVAIINFGYFRPKVWYQTTDAEKFSGESWEKQLTISIFDYLPIFANAPPTTKAPDYPQTVNGGITIVSWIKGSNWQSGVIDVKSNEATLEIPLFYFPGFKAKIDGHPLELGRDNDSGIIRVKVPEGSHQIYIKLYNTPVRQLGDVATIITVVGILFYLFYAKKNNKL